jgi:NADPH:quinone reductase-like Zn-dependent oxidoreductase
MRGIAIDRYGGNDEMTLRDDLPEPKVGPDSVLVRTRAVGVNPVDWKVVRGYLQGAFPSHFPLVPCWDLAGVVEAVGPAVTEWSPGDEVVAYDRQDHLQWGTLSELVSVPIRCVGPKPQSLSWNEAGCLPLAGMTAWQVVVAALEVQPGDTVLVHAAAGGVGSFATQIAVARGARVIGTASPGNHDYLRGLGAEPVAYGDGLIEAVKALAPTGVDAIVDLVGGDALDATPAVLAPGGRLASIVDADTTKAMGGRYVFVRTNPAHLVELGQLADAGRLKVEISGTYKLEEAVAAFDQVEDGHGRGKVVIVVSD